MEDDRSIAPFTRPGVGVRLRIGMVRPGSGGWVRRRRASATDNLSLASVAGLHVLGRRMDDAGWEPDDVLHTGDGAGRGSAASAG